MNTPSTRLVAVLVAILAVLPWLSSGRAEVLPGPVVVPVPTFTAPDATFMTEGVWGVPTARLEPVTVGGAARATLAGRSLAASGPSPATGQRDALEAAHSLLRQGSPVWEVEGGDSPGLREGDRVVSGPDGVPRVSPGPGQWLVVNADGFRTVSVRDVPPLRERDRIDLDVVGFRLENTAGTSGSLLMAVAWVDALTPGDLTAGRRVAITGQVSSSGDADEVRYVREKAEGSRAEGFEFLAPGRTTLAQVVEGLGGR